VTCALIVGGRDGLSAALATALGSAVRVPASLREAVGAAVNAERLVLLPAASAVDGWPAVRPALDLCFDTVQAAWPAMLQRGFGRIVIVVPALCLAGRSDMPGAAVATALQGLVKVLAQEGGRHGITANLLAVATADDRTPMPPVGRAGADEDVARAVAFLCADSAEFLTGSTLVVDGGLTMR